MAIILEGPDAAGKTTLSQRLRAIEPALHFYTSGGAPKSPDELKNFCDEQTILSFTAGQILDRITPISHPIYHKLDAPVLEYLQGVLDTILTSPNLIIVYCRPSNDLLMMPEKHQWKDYDTEDDKQKILTRQHEFIRAYDKMFESIPHVAYDYSDVEHNMDLEAMLAISQFNEQVLTTLKDMSNESKRSRLSASVR